MELQSFHPVMPDDEPKLQRAESPPQGYLPIAIVKHCAGFGRLVFQILWQNAQRFNQCITVRDIEAVAIKIGKHPFVWIEAVAVGVLDSPLEVAKFRTQCRRA
jgi:hypothetical protein